MILDKRTEFADAVALNTGAAGTYLIGSQLDLSEVRDVGNGKELYFVVTVATGIEVGASTGTVAFKLASDDSASVSTTTSTVHYTSAEFATSTTTDTTTLAAGTVLFAVPLPLEGNAYERYLGILQVTGTTAISAGAINAFLTFDVQKWKAYADAI
jgi:hypothetical protein